MLPTTTTTTTPYRYRYRYRYHDRHRHHDQNHYHKTARGAPTEALFWLPVGWFVGWYPHLIGSPVIFDTSKGSMSNHHHEDLIAHHFFIVGAPFSLKLVVDFGQSQVLHLARVVVLASDVNEAQLVCDDQDHVERIQRECAYSLSLRSHALVVQNIVVNMSWQPYQGPHQKLVIALDLGTTFSGVSYRFPAQDNSGGNAKIPTVLYYDQSGDLMAAGAEALDEGVIRSAEDEGWVKYSSHPNGWEGTQQKKLCRAAVYAGLIPNNDKGQERIHFVTEGEASLHFCIDRGLSSFIKDEEGVMIIDAGGGTVDISTYSRAPNDQSFEEIATPACVFTGSIFVTCLADVFLKSGITTCFRLLPHSENFAEKLKGSQYEGEAELITECFDKTTKHRFRSTNEPAYIKFGTMRDTDTRLDIRSGQMKLAGSDVASFFEPSASLILQQVDYQRLKARRSVSSIFLVGGFAESTWLFSKMREYVELSGVSLSRPANSPLNKAVADGTISFYIHNIVSARAAKYTYGLKINTIFNSLDPEHTRRRVNVYRRADGEEVLGGQHSIILPKAKNYSILFTIKANTHKAAKALNPLWAKDGGLYFRLDFDIIIFFG
ncbi:hypothetical protein IW262DRAFT_1486534 [Armillaria fumosa]|nr:hypothetical protein IW262DRAFT_1486534 [Armillaria fumosa]